MIDKFHTIEEIARNCLGFKLTKMCPKHSDGEECEWCYNSAGKIYTRDGLVVISKICEALQAQADKMTACHKAEATHAMSLVAGLEKEIRHLKHSYQTTMTQERREK